MAFPTWMALETSMINQAVGSTTYTSGSISIEVIKLENGNVDVPIIGVVNESPAESARKIKLEAVLRSTLP